MTEKLGKSYAEGCNCHFCQLKRERDTLPPVVSDPKVCAARGYVFELPHDWEPVQTERGSLGDVCRYCGGRRP